MGKLLASTRKNAGRSKQLAAMRRQLAALRRRRKALEAELAEVESSITKLEPRRQISTEEMDRLLDQLSEGLDHLQPLPADFSRADIYDDHD